MVVSDLSSPVVVDGRLSDEKLLELLGLQAEYPELDFKRKINLTTKEGLVELAKDVGAMQVLGGYIVAGVDGHGVPAGDMDGADSALFDEANLAAKLRKYLPEPLTIRTRMAERGGHAIALIYVERHPSGCAIFRSDGQYEKRGELQCAFRAGDVFWRNGTRSERITQQGFEQIVARRIADEKSGWLEEQQEIRRRERAEVQAAYESRDRAEAALGSVNLDLPPSELNLAALELVRRTDTIAVRFLLNDALARARAAIDLDDIETALGDVLDKLTCLAATFLTYEQDEWFDRVIVALAQIYSMPLGEDDARRFGYSTHIDPQEKAPRVWLQIIERVYGLGALAVRRRNWNAVRALTLQRPERLDEYDANWLRHALTMASRAQHLLQPREDGRTLELSLLSLARNEIERLPCLRLDGLAGDDDAIITSLAQFDVLANLAAIDGSGDVDTRVFWTNFARFRQQRIQPIVEQLLADSAMRQAIFKRGDEDLALALAEIQKVAHQEGFRYDGFMSWDRTPVGDFIAQNLPAQP